MKRVSLSAVALLACITSCSKPQASLGVSGIVEATESRLGFQSAGRIAEVTAHEGDRIERGAVIAKLDTAEADARRKQAVAHVEAAKSALQELLTGSRTEEIRQAEANVDAARTRVEDANRDLDRNRRLYAGGAIAFEVLQKTEAAASVADAQLRQAREQERLVKTGARQERIDLARAQVREAEAALAAVDAFLANTIVTAPVSGIVTVRHHEPNETVAPGQPIVTMIDPGDRWVRVYIPENRLGAVRLGSKATIKSDTFHRTYAGIVSFIASEAEFTPKNVQTNEERVRLVYAVKVRIAGDAAMELKPGMPVDVEVALQ